MVLYCFFLSLCFVNPPVHSTKRRYSARYMYVGNHRLLPESNEPLWLTDWTHFQPNNQTPLVTNVANFAQNRWLRSAQYPTQPKSYFTGDKHRTKSQNLAEPSFFFGKQSKCFGCATFSALTTLLYREEAPEFDDDEMRWWHPKETVWNPSRGVTPSQGTTQDSPEEGSTSAWGSQKMKETGGGVFDLLPSQRRFRSKGNAWGPERVCVGGTNYWWEKGLERFLGTAITRWAEGTRWMRIGCATLCYGRRACLVLYRQVHFSFQFK